MTDLPHLAARLYGAPLLIARPKLETILAAIGPRLLGLGPLPAATEAAAAPELHITEDGIAVLPILGTLVHRSAYLGAASGLQSYLEIETQAEALFADPRARAVVLEIDSAGGEAAGVFETAARLRALSVESGKFLWAVATPAALSAAYALAAAADAIWVTETAEVGSIGVVAVHADQSAKDAKEGIAYTFLHAGERKLDGNPHRPLSEEARAAIQADVEALYERFVDWVAKRRGLRPEAVRAQQAAIYRGQAAIQAGLADAIGGLREAIAALSGRLEVLSTPAKGRIFPGGHMQTPVTAPAAAGATLDAAELERQMAERAAALLEIAEQARALGVAIDAAAALREGLSPEALARRALAEAARRDASHDIVSVQPAAAAPKSSLVEAARRFAQGA